MAASYVVKTWNVNSQINERGNYVEITGRAPGIIAWFLSIMGIVPTVSIYVTDKLYIFESGSLSGRFYKTIPISKISSVYYGYSKPWQKAIALAIFLGSFLGPMFAAMGGRKPAPYVIMGVLLSVVIAVVYYFLNKQLTLGVFEIGGGSIGVDIKRSIIEGKKLDEKDAEQVGNIIQQLLILKN